MIGRLRGELLYKKPPQLLIEVAGVGYELEAPMSTFYELPAVGTQVTLHTHFLVRDDAQSLYGFAREAERALFRQLLRVTGVGAKLGLAILSGMDTEAFARAIEQGDVTALMRLPGIGRRTAERLVLELRDRLDLLPGLGTPGTAGPTRPLIAPVATPAEDAISALVALGYRSPDASRMVRAVEGSGLSSEDLIRAALKATVKG